MKIIESNNRKTKKLVTKGNINESSHNQSESFSHSSNNIENIRAPLLETKYSL